MPYNLKNISSKTNKNYQMFNNYAKYIGSLSSTELHRLFWMADTYFEYLPVLILFVFSRIKALFCCQSIRLNHFKIRL